MKLYKHTCSYGYVALASWDRRLKIWLCGRNLEYPSHIWVFLVYLLYNKLFVDSGIVYKPFRELLYLFSYPEILSFIILFWRYFSEKIGVFLSFLELLAMLTYSGLYKFGPMVSFSATNDQMWIFNSSNRSYWYDYDDILSYCYKNKIISVDVGLGSCGNGPNSWQRDRKSQAISNVLIYS